MFLWTGRMHFRQPCWKFIARRPKTFRLKSKKADRFYFLGKSCLSLGWSFETKNALLTTMPKTLWQNAETFRSMSEKVEENRILSKIFFLENFSLTRSGSKQSRKLCRKVFARRTKAFSLKVRESDKEIYIFWFIIFASKTSHGHQEGNFEDPAENIKWKDASIALNVLKTWKLWKTFEKFVSP